VTVLAGCSSSKKTSTGGNTSSTGGSTTTTAASLPSATLNGSGSTFQAAFDNDAIQQFDQAHSGVTINYAGGGSGKGLNDLKSKLVDFAGTDAPIATADLTSYGGPGSVLYFPTVAAPITLSYNVSGVKSLTLSAATIAKIFLGKITTWSDPAIAADGNSGLPSTKITPVHRSDSSGTTNNFTLYLKKAAPTDWTLGSGKTVTWPSGVAGNGNTGIATAIKQTDGSIGYVDFSDAKATNLSLASIKTSSGAAVAPSLDGASAAVAAATVNPDLTYDPSNAEGPGAYPITSPTWIVVYKTQADHNKGTILKAFLNYLLTTGQTDLAKNDNFAPLPSSLLDKAKAQLDQIVIP
jgi:phosphate transport system substrate-binding protein